MKRGASFFPRVLLWSLPIAILATIACVFGAQGHAASFYPAYLVAFLFWLGLSLGSLATLLLHHVTGGGWGIPIRRVLEGAVGTLPLLAVGFLPIALTPEKLYVWARPEAVAADELLQHKARYLNVESFQYRAIGYFAAWILLGLILNLLSAGTDPAGEPRRRRWLALISGPGLVVWCLTVTFAAVDWGMSLEPHWFSSMYGVLFIGGQGVSALSLAILSVVLLRETPPWTETLTTDRLHDLGNLLLAFVLFWSYVSFTQFLIIWSGNLPEEIPWYLHRSAGGWQYVPMVLAALHFLLPFLLLLSRQTKRRPAWLLCIALLLMSMRLVDLYWLIMPAFSPERFTLHWLIAATVLAVGGWWISMFTWRLSARSQLKVYDAQPAEDQRHAVAEYTAH